LTSEQTDFVLRAADSIAPSYRQRFLDAIADQLTCRPTISNHELAQIVGAIRRHMILGAGTPELGPDEDYE
jgi:hypothetical protein